MCCNLDSFILYCDLSIFVSVWHCYNYYSFLKICKKSTSFSKILQLFWYTFSLILNSIHRIFIEFYLYSILKILSGFERVDFITVLNVFNPRIHLSKYLINVILAHEEVNSIGEHKMKNKSFSLSHFPNL